MPRLILFILLIRSSKNSFVNAGYVVENDVEQQCEESQREDGACAIELDNEIRTKETHIAEDEVTVESKDWELKSKEWEMKSKEWEMKYKNLKKVYVQLTIRYSEQSLKFEHLLKSKTNAGNTTDHTTDHTTGHFPSPNTGIQVQSNDDIFTPRELIYLQCMSLDKSKDSTFIMKCLEFAYKNNLPILRFKTLKGKPESVQFDEGGEAENIAGKDPLTPMKVNRIKDLFLERLSKCQIDPVVYGERVKDSNINKLFASGVKNISKKHNE